METNSPLGHQTAGELLRAARAERGLSQAELGWEVGRSQSEVSSWEAGRYRPCLEVAVALQELLGVAVGEWRRAAKSVVRGAKSRRRGRRRVANLPLFPLGAEEVQ